MFGQKLFSGALVAGATTAAAVILSSAPAFADIVYSNLGPGQTAGPSSLSVTGSNFGYNGLAEPFTSSGNFNLSEIDVALIGDQGTSQAVVALATLNGTTIGPALMSWTLSNLPKEAGLAITIAASQEITGITGIELLAGQRYVLEVAPGASDSFLHWDGTIVPSADRYVQFTAGGPFTTHLAGFQDVQGQFDVLGNPVTTAVPEPASLALFGGGLLGLLGLRRRGKAVLA